MAPILIYVISKKQPLYFTLAIEKLYSLKQVKFLICLSICFCVKVHSVNCLKTFDFKLLFVCALKLLRALWHICI